MSKNTNRYKTITIRSIFLLILIFSSSYLFCQESIYALTDDNSIIRVNPSNCSYETVIVGNQLNTNVSFTDIAFAQGDLYACGSSLLYKINVVSGEVDWINLGNGLDPILNGLTADNNGNLYWSGLGLKRYNLFSGNIDDFGSLNFYTQGDLEYLNDELYITANDSTSTGKLLKVHFNPFSVSVVGSIPQSIFGLARHPMLSSNELFFSKDSTLQKINTITAETTIMCPEIFNGIRIYGMTLGSSYLNTINNDISNLVKVFNQEEKVTIVVDTSLLYGSKFSLSNSLGQLISSSRIFNETTIVDLKDYSGLLFVALQLPNGSIYTRRIVL